MKTLVFCTSYVADASVWELRLRLWIQSLRSSSLKFDQLLIVDDASPTLPTWNDVDVFKEDQSPTPESVNSQANILLYHHRVRLGRQSIFEFPGWHRSFVFGVRYGISHGFNKIIHVESDAHLVSNRICQHLNLLQAGWITFWSQKYNMPEIAIQAAAGEHIADLADFVDRPYSSMAGHNHELQFPFSRIERKFKGDRYGEDSSARVPRNADYSSQTLLGMEPTFYWWLRPEDETRSRQFHAPFSEFVLDHGWGEPDLHFVWMLGFESTMILPGVDLSDFDLLELDLSPCIFGDRGSQRIFILANDVFLREVRLSKDKTVACNVSQVNQKSSSVLRFIHPDAFAPCEIGDHAESRQLSFALCGLKLGRISDVDPTDRRAE